MPDPDLKPATREELLHSIAYALRYDRRGKATRRNAEIMAQMAAESFIEIFEQAGFVVMKRPGSRGAAEVRGEQERNKLTP